MICYNTIMQEFNAAIDQMRITLSLLAAMPVIPAVLVWPKIHTYEFVSARKNIAVALLGVSIGFISPVIGSLATGILK